MKNPNHSLVMALKFIGKIGTIHCLNSQIYLQKHFLFIALWDFNFSAGHCQQAEKVRIKIPRNCISGLGLDLKLNYE